MRDMRDMRNVGDRTQVMDRVSVEASDLGWGPGEVRNTVTHDGAVYRFSRTERDHEGEALAWWYVSDTGRAMVVFND